MLPMLPLGAISGAWRGVLYSESRFRIASIAPLATPLVTVAVLYGYSGAGIGLLAIATTLGYLAELSLLALALRTLGMPLFPRWRGTHFLTAQVRKQYVAVAGGTLVMSVSTLVNQTLAAQTGPGGVSTYNLGTRLIAVFLTVGPAALGTVILPRFSQTAADEQWSSLRRLVKHYMIAGMAAALPVIAAIFLCSPLLVRLLFQSKALSSSAADQIASIQSLSFLQLPFAIGLTVMFGVLASIKSNQILFRISVASLTPTILVSWLLARSHGILGITIAPALAQALVFVLLVCLGFRRIGNLENLKSRSVHPLRSTDREITEQHLVATASMRHQAEDSLL